MTASNRSSLRQVRTSPPTKRTRGWADALRIAMPSSLGELSIPTTRPFRTDQPGRGEGHVSEPGAQVEYPHPASDPRFPQKDAGRTVEQCCLGIQPRDLVVVRSQGVPRRAPRAPLDDGVCLHESSAHGFTRARAYPVPEMAWENPPRTILPSGWIARLSATSAKDPSSTVNFPPLPKLASTVPSTR